MKKLNFDKLGTHVIAAVALTLVIIILVIFLLRLFTRHGREFEMPSFIGQNAEELTQSGKSEGFVFIVNEHLYEEGKEPGSVIKQDPAPGEKVKKGRKIYLTVATDVPPTIKMPELHDVSLRQAQIMLEAQGLILSNVIEKPSPYENAVLEVLYRGHAIAAGTDIKMGEKITLVIGKDISELPEEETAEEPVN